MEQMRLLVQYAPVDRVEFILAVRPGDGAVLVDARPLADFAVGHPQGALSNVLRPVFASLRIHAAQALAFTMPSVRPTQPNARHDLIRHFTPDTAKLVLQVNSLQKSGRTAGTAKWAAHLAYRWLKDSFPRVEVTHAQTIEPQ